MDEVLGWVLTGFFLLVISSGLIAKLIDKIQGRKPIPKMPFVESLSWPDDPH